MLMTCPMCTETTCKHAKMWFAKEIFISTIFKQYFATLDFMFNLLFTCMVMRNKSIGSNEMQGGREHWAVYKSTP